MSESKIETKTEKGTGAVVTAMIAVQTDRFGEVRVSAASAIRIPGGLLGFPDSTRFALLESGDDSPFYWLQSLDQGELAFVVTDPVLFFPDYTPDLNREEMDALGIIEADDLDTLVILSLRGAVDSMTANLQGPIVINAKTRVGRQVVLRESGYQTRHRLFPDPAEPSVTP